jgi:hypothetical protein
MTEDWAPNFNKYAPYPNAGERLGPAWRLAWKLLGDGQVHNRQELCDRVSLGSDVTPRTVENLLRKATSCGLLVLVARTPGNPAKGGQVPLLARADRFYAQHPDRAPEGYQPPAPQEVG